MSVFRFKFIARGSDSVLFFTSTVLIFQMTHKAVRTRVQPESQLQLNQSVIHWTVEEARKIDNIVLDKVSFALKWVRRSHTDVSCDLQIMSNVHENDVIINVTLSSRIMMSLMGVLSWKWLGGSLTRTSFGLAPLTLSKSNVMSWFKHQLPADIYLSIWDFFVLAFQYTFVCAKLPSPPPSLLLSFLALASTRARGEIFSILIQNER